MCVCVSVYIHTYAGICFYICICVYICICLKQWFQAGWSFSYLQPFIFWYSCSHAHVLACPYADHSPYRLLLLPPRECWFQPRFSPPYCPRYYCQNCMSQLLLQPSYFAITLVSFCFDVLNCDFPWFLWTAYIVVLLLHLLCLPCSSHCLSAAVFQIHIHFSRLVPIPRIKLSDSRPQKYLWEICHDKHNKVPYLFFKVNISSTVSRDTFSTEINNFVGVTIHINQRSAP